MRVSTGLYAIAISASTVVATIDVGHSQRPTLMVPTLPQIRDILAKLEAPILNTVVERSLLAVDPNNYIGRKSKLVTYLADREDRARGLGRYAYGALEYPFSHPEVVPDVATVSNSFPPGRFHEDTFIGNANLTHFYTTTFLPALSNTTSSPSAPSSFFFHLTNASINYFPDETDTDAALNLDVTLLQLLSHRVHIGKIVAEAKYAGDPTNYYPLIHAGNATAIRALLTNLTQEARVLAQADAAVVELTNAWITAGEIAPSSSATQLRNLTAVLFRQLIDVTTDIEVKYLLGRLP